MERESVSMIKRNVEHTYGRPYVSHWTQPTFQRFAARDGEWRASCGMSLVPLEHGSGLVLCHGVDMELYQKADPVPPVTTDETYLFIP
jgi:hypothetical protein